MLSRHSDSILHADMFKALLLVLALLLIASVGILFSQHSITSTRTTLRERLQYMEAAAETEIANVVVRVADAGATTQPPRKALQRRRVTASSADSSSSSNSAAQPLRHGLSIWDRTQTRAGNAVRPHS